MKTAQNETQIATSPAESAAGETTGVANRVTTPARAR